MVMIEGRPMGLVDYKWCSLGVESEVRGTVVRSQTNDTSAGLCLASDSDVDPVALSVPAIA
jgi:hypothetical protein